MPKGDRTTHKIFSLSLDRISSITNCRCQCHTLCETVGGWWWYLRERRDFLACFCTMTNIITIHYLLPNWLSMDSANIESTLFSTALWQRLHCGSPRRLCWSSDCVVMMMIPYLSHPIQKKCRRCRCCHFDISRKVQPNVVKICWYWQNLSFSPKSTNHGIHCTTIQTSSKHWNNGCWRRLCRTCVGLNWSPSVTAIIVFVLHVLNISNCLRRLCRSSGHGCSSIAVFFEPLGELWISVVVMVDDDGGWWWCL